MSIRIEPCMLKIINRYMRKSKPSLDTLVVDEANRFIIDGL